MRNRIAPWMLALASTFTMASTSVAAQRALSTEVTLAPMSKPPGAYQATVEVRDAASQEVLSAPVIAFLQGEPTTTTTQLEGGEIVRFTIQVNAAGSEASYTAEIELAGKSVSSQKAKIALAR